MTNKYILIVAFIIIASVVAVSLWPALLNKSYYSTDKNQAHSKLEKIISNLHPTSAQVLYTDVRDTGCDSNGVGLASYLTCSLTAEKYFKTDNGPEAIKQLDHQLIQQGFTSSTYSNDYNLQKTLAVPKGSQEGSAPYKSTGEKEYLILYVEFFDQGNTSTENYRVQKLIEDKKLPQPSVHDTYFGVHLQKTYWKCDSTSLLEYYCPTAPSKPQ